MLRKDFSLPNMSAYTIHVLKMCDAFSESYYDVSLLLPHIRKGYKLKKIQTDGLVIKSVTSGNFVCNAEAYEKPIKNYNNR